MGVDLMGKNRVTTLDIARAAGVSQATVSMILNKKYNVSFSKETVEKVEQTANVLGYVIPKRRIHKDTRTEKLIVAFCPTFTNPYYVMLLQGIEEIAWKRGYGVFVCNTQRDLKREEEYLKLMSAMRPMGIIYTCNPSPSFKKQVKDLADRIPLVIINNRENISEVDVVELNNTKPGKLMAEYLISLGHREVAFISPPLTHRQQQRFKRVEGFIKEYEKAGMKDSVIVKAANEEQGMDIPSLDSEYKIGYNLTRELLKEGRNLTAFAAMNDMIALGILDALGEAKLRVPADVSVIGCDNILFGRLNTIGLTTIEHFVPLKGRDACDIIVKKIESRTGLAKEQQPVSIYHIEYEPKLMIRQTTGYAHK